MRHPAPGRKTKYRKYPSVTQRCCHRDAGPHHRQADRQALPYLVDTSPSLLLVPHQSGSLHTSPPLQRGIHQMLGGFHYPAALLGLHLPVVLPQQYHALSWEWTSPCKLPPDGCHAGVRLPAGGSRRPMGHRTDRPTPTLRDPRRQTRGPAPSQVMDCQQPPPHCGF